MSTARWLRSGLRTSSWTNSASRRFGTERHRSARDFSSLNPKRTKEPKMPITVEARYPQVAKLMVSHVAKSNPSTTQYDDQERIADTPVTCTGRAALAPKVRAYIEEAARLCRPDDIYVCDGSEIENARLLKLLVNRGTIEPLPKYENCWLTRTNPADVARVESRTFISTCDKEDAIPTPRNGVKGTLGNWIAPSDMDNAILERFPNCMKGMPENNLHIGVVCRAAANIAS